MLLLIAAALRSVQQAGIPGLGASLCERALHCRCAAPCPCRWVGFLFALGSLLFLITGIARLTKPVGAPEVWPPGISSKAAGLSAWPEVIACYFVFFPACLIQVSLYTSAVLGSCCCNLLLQIVAASCFNGRQAGVFAGLMVAQRVGFPSGHRRVASGPQAVLPRVC